MEKIVKIFLLILLFACGTFSANASCGGDVKEVLGIKDEDISTYSSSFSCYDILYLKQTGIGKISYQDYLQMFPKNMGETFVKYDLNPGMSDEIYQTLDQKRMELNESNIKQAIIDKVEKVKTTQQVHLNDSGFFEKTATLGVCSNYTFPEFDNLSASHKPVSVSRGHFLTPFSQTIGIIAPSKDNKSISFFHAGNLAPKQVPWDTSCYNDGFGTTINALSSGCLICPVYETLYDFVSASSYSFFVNIKDYIFVLTASLIVIFLLLDILNMFYPFLVDEKSHKEPKKIIQEYRKKIIYFAIASLVLLPSPESFFAPRYIIDLISTPILNLSTILSQAIMGQDYVCSYDVKNLPDQFEMLGNTFKQNYMCVVESSFKILFTPIKLGFSLVWKGHVITGLIIAFLFLKNLFDISFYLISPLIQIAITLFFLPITIMCWVLDFKTNLFSWKKIWDYLIQIFFISLFIAFFSMLIMELIKSVAIPDTANLTSEQLANFDYSGSSFWEVIIVGFLASFFIQQIPNYVSTFSKFFNAEGSFDTKFGKDLEKSAQSGVKDVLGNKKTFQKGRNYFEDPKVQRGLGSMAKKTGLKIKGWFKR